MMKTIAAALVAATLLAPAAVMAEVPEAREPVSLTVSTQGLDLTQPAGVKALQSRMDKAIAAACNPGDRIGADLSPDYRCRQEMAANVEPTLQQIAARAHGVHLSLN
jgi:UrcA family protein